MTKFNQMYNEVVKEEAPGKGLSAENKDQLVGLVNDTIIPALYEDLSYDTDTKQGVILAAHYLIKVLQDMVNSY